MRNRRSTGSVTLLKSDQIQGAVEVLHDSVLNLDGHDDTIGELAARRRLGDDR